MRALSDRARRFARQPDFPIGIKFRGALRAHPGSESFVQPKIIPPSHGHEIAEPLVRDLVRDDCVDALLRFRRRIFGIEKKDADSK